MQELLLNTARALGPRVAQQHEGDVAPAQEAEKVLSTWDEAAGVVHRAVEIDEDAADAFDGQARQPHGAHA